MKSIRHISKKRHTRKKIKRVHFETIGKGIKGGLGKGLTGYPSTLKPVITSRRSKNDSKIRVQFLNPRTSATPYSVISVLKGPSTGIFDYMWYNINDIEEMLSTAMYGLKTDPPLPSEKVFNITHNDKSNELSKEKEKQEGEGSRKKNRYDSDPFDRIRQ
jgi:hypothetical protein